MNQLKNLFTSLSLRQRLTIGAITVAVLAALAGFLQWQKDRDYRPLYSSLAPEDAAVVIQKLRESNVEYKLADNGSSVLAPSARVAELRLELASAGIPKSGRIGFELFDKTNFGMTEFTEHVNYRRALEGELERSVMALSEVEQARVHLTFPKESVFLESRQSAKASVLLKIRLGAKLAPPNVLAITHLVSSAVEGLAPESVSVMDMRGNLLNRAKNRLVADGSPDAEAAVEYQQKIEKDLVAKVNATLEPLLGAEKFHAAASVECDLTSGEQNEETFDPTKSVMATSQRTEDQQTSSAAGGTPGTASNLPRPAKALGSSEGVAHRTEQVTYQTSRTTRHTKLPQGAIKRVSLAILLDQSVRWEGSGAKARKVLVPPSPDKLKTIHDVVAAAVGFSPQRGDQLTVETLPFESTLNVEAPEAAAPAPAPATLMDRLKNVQMVGLLAAGVLTLLLVVGGGIYLLLKTRRRPVTPELKPALDAGPPGKGAAQLSPADAAARLAELSLQSGPPANAGRFPAIAASRVEVLAEQLRAGAAQDTEVYAGVLRNWLSQETNN